MGRIEQELFGDSKFYVSRFEMEENGILILTFVCCGDPKIVRIAQFTQVRRAEFELQSDDGFSVPWAVIGFECEELLDDWWIFRLHTDTGDLKFESDWPVITIQG